MIPKRMHDFLRDALPERTWQTRRQVVGPLVFMEFGPLDVDRLHRLGIEVDNLGPRLVVCMWDEENPLEIGGYLVVDNLSMGRPSMGGIRMLPDITPAVVHNLARGMTMKNAAADLPFGGGKAGIVAPQDLSPEEHEAIIRGFARLIRHYVDLYNPGPDVGTDDADMKTIAIENGIDCALSKPVDMGGNRIDELGAAASGVVIAFDTLIEQLRRLKTLPQFRNLVIPEPGDMTVLVQGFGAVGAHVALQLWERRQEDPKGAPRVVGISDAEGYLFCETGLPVDELLARRDARRIVSRPTFLADPSASIGECPPLKFSNARDDLLRESAFCLVPASPQANYLDVDASSNPSMTVDRMGRWAMIIEGANTYSPDPQRRAARRRMERVVYRERGVLIATDYLVNSGGVIFAAHERLIPTPSHLQIPPDRLGDRQGVEAWLREHADQFAELARQRQIAAEAKRDDVIRRNMIELVDRLVADDDLLPCQAAEQISISRIVARERVRTVADVMGEIATIRQGSPVQDAADLLVRSETDILAVVSEENHIVGVVTDWDVTEAAAGGELAGLQLEDIMTAEAITCRPGDSIIEAIRKLRHYEISAMPVLGDRDEVIGVISSDLLARRTLYRLLQTQRE